MATGNNQGVSINDQYVVLLEKSLEESKSQREENKRILALLEEERRQNTELVKKMMEANNKTPSPNSVSKKRKRAESKLEISSPCQRKTKEIYKELVKKDDFGGYNFSEMFSSATNRECTTRIVQAVVDASGQETFPRLHIEESLRIYFRSLRDHERRKQKGVDKSHKIKCRRQIRLREKCEKLTKALRSSNWEKAAIEEAEAILAPEYMSSEESEVEIGEDGKEAHVFCVRKLPWERKKMRVIKRKLRKIYDDSLSARQRMMITPRRRTDDNSNRAVPADAPEWAVRIDEEEQ